MESEKKWLRQKQQIDFYKSYIDIIGMLHTTDHTLNIKFVKKKKKKV